MRNLRLEDFSNLPESTQARAKVGFKPCADSRAHAPYITLPAATSAGLAGERGRAYFHAQLLTRAHSICAT